MLVESAIFAKLRFILHKTDLNIFNPSSVILKRSVKVKLIYYGLSHSLIQISFGFATISIHSQLNHLFRAKPDLR